jgi:hypothetical protein
LACKPFDEGILVLESPLITSTRDDTLNMANNITRMSIAAMIIIVFNIELFIIYCTWWCKLSSNIGSFLANKGALDRLFNTTYKKAPP